MSSKTIVEIKNELDNLGITYKSGLRKAELLALLQVCNIKLDIKLIFNILFHDFLISTPINVPLHLNF